MKKPVSLKIRYYKASTSISSPSVKAIKALENSSALKPFPKRFQANNNNKPNVYNGFIRPFDTRTDTFQQTFLGWPLRMIAIYPTRRHRFFLYGFVGNC